MINFPLDEKPVADSSNMCDQDGSMGSLCGMLKTIGRLAAPVYKNCSRLETPSAHDFLTHLESFQRTLLILGCCFTAVILCLALIHWLHVYRYVSIENRRNKLYWLITLFPVSAGCCLIGMIMPRTSMIITAIGTLYYLMCLFVIVSLARHLFGGRSSFSTCLQYEDRPIDFRSPPFCCLIPRLPRARATEKNIRHLEWLVLQAPVVRAVVSVFDVVAVAELRDSARPFLHYADLCSVVSLMLAIFGVHTLARLTSDKLSEFCFMTIFRFVDVSLLFFTAQQPMIFQNILLRFDLIDCGPLLSAQENANFVCNFLIICEMFVLSLLATVLLAPRRNAMFDVYKALKTIDTLDEVEVETSAYV